jgi:hypothetical protein
MKVKSLKHRLLVSNIGKRCKDFTWHCIVCESYRFLDDNGRFPHSFDEVNNWAAPFRAADDLLEDV